MWGWFPWIYDLTNGDIFKEAELSKLNHREVLNWLCYKISKYNYEESKIKK